MPTVYPMKHLYKRFLLKRSKKMQKEKNQSEKWQKKISPNFKVDKHLKAGRNTQLLIFDCHCGCKIFNTVQLK